MDGGRRRRARGWWRGALTAALLVAAVRAGSGAELGVRPRRARGPLARVPRQSRLPRQRARAARVDHAVELRAPDLPRLRQAALPRQRRAASRRRAAAPLLPPARLLLRGGRHQRRRERRRQRAGDLPHHRGAARAGRHAAHHRAGLDHGADRRRRTSSTFAPAWCSTSRACRRRSTRSRRGCATTAFRAPTSRRATRCSTRSGTAPACRSR